MSQEISREIKQYLVGKLQTVLVIYFTSYKNHHSSSNTGSIYRTLTICLGKMIYLHLHTHSPKDICKNIHNSVHTIKQCKLKKKNFD